MSTMSTTELQREIKNCVVEPLMNGGIGDMRLIQIDNYKWLVVVEVEGEERFAEIGITAKKADFSYDDAIAANNKYTEKAHVALQREADRAAKKAAKLNTKGESKNSSGNLDSSSVVNGEYVPFAKRYTSDDF